MVPDAARATVFDAHPKRLVRSGIRGPVLPAPYSAPRPATAIRGCPRRPDRDLGEVREGGDAVVDKPPVRTADTPFELRVRELARVWGDTVHGATADAAGWRRALPQPYVEHGYELPASAESATQGGELFGPAWRRG